MGGLSLLRADRCRGILAGAPAVRPLSPRPLASRRSAGRVRIRMAIRSAGRAPVGTWRAAAACTAHSGEHSGVPPGGARLPPVGSGLAQV